MPSPKITVDGEVVPWTVRYSTRAKRVRIVVGPDKVEVVAPVGAPLTGRYGIESFVEGKKEWIADAVRRYQPARRRNAAAPYTNGSRVFYRGRRLALSIIHDRVDGAEVDCPGRFVVRVPPGLAGDDEVDLVRSALHGWMKERAEPDAERWVQHYSALLSVVPERVRLGNQKTLWGSCGRHGALSINWRLIQAPASVMEYVAAHEVCHLIERSHSARFWRVMSSVMPDWRDRRANLRRWEREMMIEGRLE